MRKTAYPEAYPKHLRPHLLPVPETPDEALFLLSLFPNQDQPNRDQPNRGRSNQDRSNQDWKSREAKGFELLALASGVEKPSRAKRPPLRAEATSLIRE